MARQVGLDRWSWTGGSLTVGLELMRLIPGITFFIDFIDVDDDDDDDDDNDDNDNDDDDDMNVFLFPALRIS